MPGPRVIRFDAVANLTYHYWHVFVPGLQPGQLYGYRVRGPFDPENGLRFDSSKVLLDPYGRAVAVPASYSREAASREGDNTAKAMKSVVVDPRAHDWEGDKPLHRAPFGQSSMRRMCAASRGTPIPGYRKKFAIPTPEWSRRYRILGNSA